MRDQASINRKISQSLTGHTSSKKGRPGVLHTEETKAKMAAAAKQQWQSRPRKTDAEKRAANKANVYAYRARKYNAILPTSDLALIKRIYEACPDGYHVDHIVALARGGPHHQDNLQYLPAFVNRSKNADNEYDESTAIAWQTLVE